MKQTKGLLHGSEVEILGKITLKGKSIFNRKNYIYVGDVKNCPMGYCAAITNRSEVSGSKPIVSDVDISLFNEGDVVLVTKEGLISFLYEKQVHQNVIMATELCNHRCIMCPQPPVLKEKNKTDFNLKLISLFDKETTEVGISGGEPTMIGDDLFKLVTAIKKQCPKAAITILSNGVRFADKSYAMKLAQCAHPNLQIDVPLFSDIPEIHNEIVGAKTFYKSIQGLYNLALFNQRIGIRFVVHKKTFKRMVKFADFVYHNLPFVSQVAFMQMETIGMAEKNIKDLWIDPFDYNNELKEAVLLLNDRRMNPFIYNAQLCVLPEEIRPFAVQSISEWKDTYLPICEDCDLKSECGGLFESNQKYHSKHIKPQITSSEPKPQTPSGSKPRPKSSFRPMPKPKDGDVAISKFVERVFTEGAAKNYDNAVIWDVPCGYGRNIIWLAEKGFRIHGVDLDEKALSFLNELIEKKSLSNISIRKEDICCMEYSNCCDILLNIHLYSDKILEKIVGMVNKNGLLIIETPELHGENYEELPLKGYIKEYLTSNGYSIIEYSESTSNNDRSAVKVVAKRIL